MSQFLDVSTLMTGDRLPTACPASSCFRSNLRYFTALQGIADAAAPIALRSLSSAAPSRKAKTTGTSTTRRRLSGGPSRGRRVRGGGGYLTQLKSHFAAGGAGRSRKLEAHNNSTASTNRKLDSTSTPHHSHHHESEFGAASEAARRLMTGNPAPALLSPFRSAAALLDLLCLNDKDGNSCAALVETVVMNNPVLNPSDEVDPCRDSCYTLLTRQLGQTLNTISAETKNPFDSALGMLMKGYGRFYCQRNSDGRYCGSFIFTNVERQNSVIYEPVSKAQFPMCQCPLTHIGDGVCDPDCYNEDCGFDAEDCLFQNMFPSEYHQYFH
eukprot:Selendium_serpulae@DN1071_c0_g1_i2.p1